MNTKLQPGTKVYDTWDISNNYQHCNIDEIPVREIVSCSEHEYITKKSCEVEDCKGNSLPINHTITRKTSFLIPIDDKFQLYSYIYKKAEEVAQWALKMREQSRIKGSKYE